MLVDLAMLAAVSKSAGCAQPVPQQPRCVVARIVLVQVVGWMWWL
jgi:hypothetical protein